MKKKVIILMLVLLVVGIGGTLSFKFLNSKDKPKEEKEKFEVVLKTDLSAEINSDITILDFIKDDNGLKIVNRDEVVDTTTLGIKNLIIKYLVDTKEREEKFNIMVVDTISPIIECEKKITTTNGVKVDLLKNVKVSDNSKEEIKATVEGTYDFNKDGSYPLKYVAVDSSGNRKEEDFTLIVEAKAKTSTTTKKDKNSSTSTSKKIAKKSTKTVKDPNVVEKYGVKITVYNIYNVVEYTDGTTDEKYDSTYYELDTSGYNGNTSKLLNEATEFVKEEEKMDNYSDMLSILNGYRTQASVSPLEYDNNLSIAATIRAMEMAYSGTFSHTRPDGSDCFTVFNDLKLRATAQGENIAARYTSVESVMNGWRNSSGHYQNMIDSRFKKVGFGIVALSGSKEGYYWVQLFSS